MFERSSHAISLERCFVIIGKFEISEIQLFLSTLLFYCLYLSLYEFSSINWREREKPWFKNYIHSSKSSKWYRSTCLDVDEEWREMIVYEVLFLLSAKPIYLLVGALFGGVCIWMRERTTAPRPYHEKRDAIASTPTPSRLYLLSRDEEQSERAKRELIVIQINRNHPIIIPTWNNNVSKKKSARFLKE